MGDRETGNGGTQLPEGKAAREGESVQFYSVRRCDAQMGLDTAAPRAAPTTYLQALHRVNETNPTIVSYCHNLHTPKGCLLLHGGDASLPQTPSPLLSSSKESPLQLSLHDPHVILSSPFRETDDKPRSRVKS